MKKPGSSEGHATAVRSLRRLCLGGRSKEEARF